VLAQADPRLLLAAADVFVLTSAWEALPFSVLEAIQAGLPVVAYDVGDLGAQIIDGASGFLVPPFDLDRLAWRVSLLVDDPALRAALGAAARRRLDACFGYAAMVAAIDAVYRRTLGLAPTPVAPPARRRPASRAGVAEVGA
jgi:glycosyltransferase involved in cell wall biosynthesis